MSSSEVARYGFPPLPIKIASSIALVAFTVYMVHTWQRELAQVKVASNTSTQTAPVQKADAPVPVSASTPTERATDTGTTVASAPVNMTTNSPENAPTSEVIAEINDPATLATLNQKVYDQINQAWQTSPTFSESLAYQVKVKEDGAIASYQPINQAAADFVQETPLANLNQSDTSAQPLGQFLVLLTPNGVLQVSPWMAAKN